MVEVTNAARFADFVGRRILRGKAPPGAEQELVQAFFGGRKDGFFVDVGANDPYQDSQSYHLECLGWTGLLIEPLPAYCELLRSKRSARVVQLACSSPANHGRFLPIQVAGVHSTLEAQPIAIGANATSVIQVETRTLDAILTDNGVSAGFDLLSIDVEGHEMEVFKGFTFDRWRPRLVLLEDHVTSHYKHRHMVRNGYKLLLRTGLNSWYVPEGEPYLHSIGAKVEIFRKYWLGLLIRRMRYRRSSD